MPWYKFTRPATCWLCMQRLPTWRWDHELLLPWAKSARDRTAPVLLVDLPKARKYLAAARKQRK